MRPDWDDIKRVLEAEYPHRTIYCGKFDGIAYEYSTSEGMLLLMPPDLRALGDKHPEVIQNPRGWNDPVVKAVAQRSSPQLKKEPRLCPRLF